MILLNDSPELFSFKKPFTDENLSVATEKFCHIYIEALVVADVVKHKQETYHRIFDLCWSIHANDCHKIPKYQGLS